MSLVRSDVQRLFNTFFDTPTHGGPPTPTRRWVPAMDLVETAEAYVLTADLPGLGESDVSVQVENGVLTIAGERTAKHEERRQGFYRLERATGAFHRAVTLPDGIDPDRIAATFDKGVLEVRVPKPEAIKPRKVEITVGAAPAAEIEGEAKAA